MSGEKPRRISRREFLARSAIGGAGLVLGCAGPLFAPASPRPSSRRVWVFADSHIGLSGRSADGRDGAEWMQMSVRDLRRNVGEVDYALALGDITDDAGREDQLRRYVRIRDGSGIRDSYELAGNHDYGAIPAGRWRKYIKRPERYVLIDGSAAWFFISAEQGKAQGKLSRSTGEWLKREVHRHRGKNVIVCSHQAVFRTVSGSGSGETYLQHRGLVARIIREVRIDLWLCGHIHGGRRGPGYIARRGRTTYINVASLNHAYGTSAANAYVLEMAEGSTSMLARCRDHDRARYLDDQEVRIEFPHPWRFSAAPVVVPARIGRRGQRVPALSAT